MKDTDPKRSEERVRGSACRAHVCAKCGAEQTWGPIYGTWVCRDCVDREWEESIRANMPANAAGNDTHALGH